jgi:hypothetical protein
MFNYKSLVCTVCLLGILDSVSSYPAQPAESLPASALVPYGRSLLNRQQGLELISSAAHFGVSFEGDECRLYVSLPVAGTDHNYLQYELDGVYQKRIRVSAGSTAPILFKATGSGPHRLWIYKATEAETGPIIIQRLEGGKLSPLREPAMPLIEFIGNSITCGAAADPSETPCGKGDYHDQHNAYYAYGPRVARALGCSFVLSSVSGIGIYRNWNSDGPTMPQVYEKEDFHEDNPKNWDFGSFTPRVVSIALGTNDFSNGDGVKKRAPFDSTAFVKGYIAFVRVVKGKYPAATIALLSSPMINGAARIQLQNCLSAVKGAIDNAYPAAKPLAVFFFEPMQAHGCSGHPDVEDHRVLSEELKPFFKSLVP